METRTNHMTTEEILSRAEDIVLEENAMEEAMGDETAEGDARGTFCNAWPNGKQGLEMLKGIVKDPIAKAAISIVITAGDAVSSRVCR